MQHGVANKIKENSMNKLVKFKLTAATYKNADLNAQVHNFVKAMNAYWGDDGWVLSSEFEAKTKEFFEANNVAFEIVDIALTNIKVVIPAGTVISNRDLHQVVNLHKVIIEGEFEKDNYDHKFISDTVLIEKDVKVSNARLKFINAKRLQLNATNC